MRLRCSSSEPDQEFIHSFSRTPDCFLRTGHDLLCSAQSSVPSNESAAPISKSKFHRNALVKPNCLFARKKIPSLRERECVINNLKAPTAPLCFAPAGVPPVRMALPLVALSLAFVSSAPKLGIAVSVVRRPASAVVLCAAGDAKHIQEAAARVVRAAEMFGSEQGAAAAEWVGEAIRTPIAATEPEELFNKQIMLFEGCVVDDDEEGSMERCKELDAALSDLDKLLFFAASKGNPKLDRALVRVKNAAAKFGDEQRRVAEVWTRQVRAEGCANPAALLEQQQLLFGQCMLEEDGSSAKCSELQVSIAALQEALGVGGRVVSTAGLK